MDAPPPPPPLQCEDDDSMYSTYDLSPYSNVTPRATASHELATHDISGDVPPPPPPPPLSDDDESPIRPQYNYEDDEEEDDFVPLTNVPPVPVMDSPETMDVAVGDIKHVLPAPRSSIYARPKPALSPRSGTSISSDTRPSQEQSFASCMYNHFDAAVEQLNSGIYSVKRVLAMARKLVAMEDEHYKSLQRALQHEHSKTDKIGADNMLGFMDVFSKSKGLFERMAIEHKHIADNINQRVLLPLTDFFHSAEARLKAIVAEQHKLSKDVAQARSLVTKSEKECRKLHTQLKMVLLAAEHVKTEGGKKDKDTKLAKEKNSFFSKMKQKISLAAAGDPKKLSEQLAQAARQYQDAVAKGNARLQLYVDQDLPRVFDELQSLEHDRLMVLNDKLETLHGAYMRVQEPMAIIATDMVQCNKHFSVPTEITRFLHNFQFAHGEPTPLQQFSYQLPCSPDDILAGRLQAHPDSVFKASLEGCMALQEQRYPALDVPRILPVLIQAIRERDGLNSEGIFRISHQRDELAAMRLQFEQGDYTVTASSPHAPAALLKEWLRDLADALIPGEHYAEAIRMTRAAGEQPIPAQSVLELFFKLDPVNRNVIREISLLCAEIAAPPHQQLNRMTVDNLAIVFAPSFLRNPSEDPMEILQNTKYEVKCVTGMLDIIAKQHANTLPADLGSLPTPVKRSPPSSTAPSPFFSPAVPTALAPPSPSTNSSPLGSPAPLLNQFNQSILAPPPPSKPLPPPVFPDAARCPAYAYSQPASAYSTPLPIPPPPQPPHTPEGPPPDAVESTSRPLPALPPSPPQSAAFSLPPQGFSPPPRLPPPVKPQ